MDIKLSPFNRTIVLFISVICLLGCQHYEVVAPVVNGWQQPGKKSDYIVQQGDTLYSVAWAFDLDYRDLVAANHLSSPYTLTPGQRLKMTLSEAVPQSTRALPSFTQKNMDKPRQEAAKKTQPNQKVQLAVLPSMTKQGEELKETTQKITKQKEIEPPHTLPVKEATRTQATKTQLASLPNLEKVAAPHADKKLQPPNLKLASNKTQMATKPIEASKKNKPAPLTSSTSHVKHQLASQRIKFWTWPTKGKVISTYSPVPGKNRGIDIAGQISQPVFAAAAGKIVYSGTGLRGYGKLLIIKHSDSYLSAYAFNQTLLAKEGKTVKAGEKIATMGRNDQGRSLLHFEIRKDGKPVNPLNYLN